MSRKGNNEGCIIKRSDGRWQGSVTVGKNANGTQRRQYVYGKTRKEVAEKLNQITYAITTNTFIDKYNNPTLNVWLDIWLNKYKKNNLKPTTFDQYESVIRVHLKPNLGNLKIVDLKPEHLQNLYNDLIEQGLSARTVKVINTILHASLKKALKSGIIYRNVCEAVELPKGPKREQRVLTLEEQATLLEELKKDRWGAAYIFALFSGLRRGEVLALTWDDVDIKNGLISVNKTLNRVKDHDKKSKKKTKLVVNNPKTENSNRIIPIVNSIIKLLIQQKKLIEKEKKIAVKQKVM